MGSDQRVADAVNLCRELLRFLDRVWAGVEAIERPDKYFDIDP